MRTRRILSVALLLLGTLPGLFAPERLALAAAPVIDSVSPSSGPIGTPITISGSGFTGASEVRFNGTPAFFALNSPSNITTAVPNGATSGPVTVTTPDGTATRPTRFTVTPNAPTVAGLSPSQGAPGITVTISGNYFSNITVVKFNGVSATFTVDSLFQIR
ncbi:MAG: IPT/TIG domain-containing protein, partial [Chloroflexi bacterium]|nr:IPT/TIG domain-containing protein [Chloroflexota bacterium]